MTSPMLISAIFFCLMGVAGVGVYVALYGSHRVLDERFADLAVRLRMEHGGGLRHEELEDESFVRSTFDWILQRVPAPDPDSPKGEKLSQALVQAGYTRSDALQ